jgi:hypothetical protein
LRLRGGTLPYNYPTIKYLLRLGTRRNKPPVYVPIPTKEKFLLDWGFDSEKE